MRAATAIRRSGRLLALGGGDGAPALAAALPKASAPRRPPSRKRSAAAAAAEQVAVKRRPAPAAAPAVVPAPSPQKTGGPSRLMEKALWAKGYSRVAGVDEAGRGPLAGPVVAAAVVLPRDFTLPPPLRLNDSKKMSEADREAVFGLLKAHPGVCWAAHSVPAAEIDRINILQATMVAMDAAVAKLAERGSSGSKEAEGRRPTTTTTPLPCPAADPAAFDADTDGGAGPGRSAGPADYVLVDGPRLPPGVAATARGTPVVKGDAKVCSIAAASVVAKVIRDRLMRRLDAAWPAYGFGGHKGYGTAAHCAAIRAHGPCPQHRRTFAPIKGMVGVVEGE